MEDVEIVKIVARLRKLGAREKETHAEVEQIRNRLREEFASRETTEIDAGRYRVRLVSYTRHAFDQKELQADRPAIYRLYSKPQVVTKIEVVG